MAAKKTEGNTTKFSKTDFDKAVKGIIKEFKKDKQIKETDLQKAVVKPMSLNADQIDDLYDQIESAGISVVD